MDNIFNIIYNEINKDSEKKRINLTRAPKKPDKNLDANRDDITFFGFGDIASYSTLPQLKQRNFPSLEVQILNPKKAQFKISRSDFLNSIPVKLNFQPVKNENIYLLVLSHSWLRTIYIGQIIQKFTENPIIWSSKIESIESDHIDKAIKFVSFEEASKMGEVTLVTSADVHSKKYANAQTVVQHGLCQSEKIISAVSSKIESTLEYRDGVHIDPSKELDAILKLTLLRNVMTKNIDSDPDINQLQFILYQYARACHIVEKTKTLESDLDEFDVKDFVYRHEIEFELVLLTTDLDHLIHVFTKEMKLSNIASIIGHMVVVSRAFSQFYFHCRVLPGSSGFDGSFEIKLDKNLDLTKSRLFITKLFIDRFKIILNLFNIDPLTTM